MEKRQSAGVRADRVGDAGGMMLIRSERVPWYLLLLFVLFYIWILWELIPPAPRPLFHISPADAQRYWGSK